MLYSTLEVLTLILEWVTGLLEKGMDFELWKEYISKNAVL